MGKSAVENSRTSDAGACRPAERTIPRLDRSSRNHGVELCDQFDVTVNSNNLISQICAQRAYLFAYGRRRGAQFDLEDLVQDTQIRAWRHRETFHGDSVGELRAWLSTIFVRVHYDQWRRRKVRMQKAHIAAGAEEIECSSERHTDASLALGRIDKLSSGQQAVLYGLLEGHDYQQIADELQVRIGTVKSRLARAREALCP